MELQIAYVGLAVFTEDQAEPILSNGRPQLLECSLNEEQHCCFEADQQGID